MKYFTKKWKNKVRYYCDSQYELIKVKPGYFNLYRRYHLVSTHFAVQYDHDHLALVVYRDKNNLLPIVHFINYDGENFIDNSEGHWSSCNEYRFIRFVSKNEFYSTVQILNDTKKFFSDMATFPQRWFGDNTN